MNRGDLGPGAWLKQLARLVQKGLVKHLPRRGCRVASLSSMKVEAVRFRHSLAEGRGGGYRFGKGSLIRQAFRRGSSRRSRSGPFHSGW